MNVETVALSPSFLASVEEAANAFTLPRLLAGGFACIIHRYFHNPTVTLHLDSGMCLTFDFSIRKTVDLILLDGLQLREPISDLQEYCVVGSLLSASKDLRLALDTTSLPQKLTLHYVPAFCLARGMSPACFAKQLLTHIQQFLLVACQESLKTDIGLNYLTQRELADLFTCSFEPHDQATEKLASESCVHHLLEARARKAPDTLALVSYEMKQSGMLQSSQSLTYAELDSIVTRCAAQLLAALNGEDTKHIADTVVGVAVHEGPELVISCLALWKAGYALLPIEFNYPDQWISHVATESRIAACICLPGQQDRVNELFASLPFRVCIVPTSQLDMCACAPVKPAELSIIPTSKNLCHVIYTSGSTGRPKGVLCEHHQLVSFALDKVRTDQISSKSRLFLATSFTFDPYLGDLAAGLAAGATLCIAPRSLIQGDLKQCLIESHATHVWATPSLWSLMDPASPREFPHLQCVGLGGEPMPLKVIKEWGSYPPIRLLNCYGVTEVAVYQFVDHFRYPTIDDGNSNNGDLPFPARIGYPMRGVEIFVLDPYKQLAPLGALGEIYMGGPQVARGYLQRPDLTQERFVDLTLPGLRHHHNNKNPDVDSVAIASKRRFFWTGDVAIHREDGRVELLGRSDLQVKINGLRVELPEIETVLRESRLVKDAVVVLQNKKTLVAFVVLIRSAESHAAMIEYALKQHCTAHLPRHMVPVHFVMLNTLPLTMSGKVNRQSLPVISEVPIQNNCQRPTEMLRPGMEAAVGMVWAEVLGLPSAQSLSPRDNFAKLGGDSLGALRVVKLLGSQLTVDSQFGVNEFGQAQGPLAVVEFLKRPILQEYAIFLESSLATTANSPQTQAQTQTIQIVEEVDAPEETERHKEINLMLVEAARQGRVDVLQAILDSGTDLGVKRATIYPGGLSPMHLAAMNGDVDMVLALAMGGASTIVCTATHCLPAHLAAKTRNGGDALRTLLSLGSPITARDNNGQTLLHHAARAGEVEALGIVAERWEWLDRCRTRSSEPSLGPFSTFLETRDRWHRTAVHWAVINGHIHTLRFLIENLNANACPKLLSQKKHGRNTHAPQEIPLETARRIHGDDSAVALYLQSLEQ